MEKYINYALGLRAALDAVTEFADKQTARKRLILERAGVDADVVVAIIDTLAALEAAAITLHRSEWAEIQSLP